MNAVEAAIIMDADAFSTTIVRPRAARWSGANSLRNGAVCATEVDQADMVEGARDGLLVCEVRNDLERPSALLEG
jgi:hypothetical protein